MKKLIGFLLLLTILNSCTSDNDFLKGKQQLEQQGYNNITNTGYKFFCCDEKEGFSTGFSCYDKNSKQVTGCFCSGLLKGVTIRFE